MTQNDSATGSPTYEVFAMRYGTRTTKKSDVYLNYNVYGEIDGSIEMDYYFWMIRGAGRTIVVDCGFAPHVGERRGRTVLAPPRQLLVAAGVNGREVSAVVVTHFHYDHIGNIDLFPNAEIVYARSEATFWGTPESRHPIYSEPVEAIEIARIREIERDGRATMIDTTATIAPGIEVVRVGGHTPGQAIVRIPTASGTTILASDAAHYDDEYQKRMPFTVMADLSELFRGYTTLAEMAQDPGTAIIPGHDPSVARLFPEASFGDGLIYQLA